VEEMTTYNPNDLIEAMTDDELRGLLEKHKGKESVEKLVNGILEAREAERNEAELVKTFNDTLKAIKLPIPPKSVHNVYNAWAKVYRPLNKKEREELKATNPNITDAELDTRRVETDKWHWAGWTTNKAMTTTSSANKATTTSTKRAITVKKIEGDSLVLVGNFRNGNEACQYLKLQTGGDSAIRVLGRFGYVNEAYTGTDFLVKQT